MNRVNSAALAASIAALAAPAMAQDTTGGYGGLRVGLASVGDVDLTYSDEGGTFGGSGATDKIDFTADSNSAIAFGGVLGYDFGTIRTDLEVDYSRNKVKSLTLNAVNGQPVTLTSGDADEICDYLEADTCAVDGNTIAIDGRLRQLSAMANIWLDIPVGEVVTPYVGGGIGVSGYEIEGEGKAGFAWQIGAGLAFNLSPSVALSADVRHRQTSGATITDEEFPDFATTVDRVKTTTFSAGLRFRF